MAMRVCEGGALAMSVWLGDEGLVALRVSFP